MNGHLHTQRLAIRDRHARLAETAPPRLPRTTAVARHRRVADRLSLAAHALARAGRGVVVSDPGPAGDALPAVLGHHPGPPDPRPLP